MCRLHWHQIILALSLVLASTITAAEKQPGDKGPGPGDVPPAALVSSRISLATFEAFCIPRDVVANTRNSGAIAAFCA